MYGTMQGYGAWTLQKYCQVRVGSSKSKFITLIRQISNFITARGQFLFIFTFAQVIEFSQQPMYDFVFILCI